MIKSDKPGTCKVSTITTTVDVKQNVPVIACKVGIATAISNLAAFYAQWLALALRNVGAGQAVKIPAMTGSPLHLLMMWLQALRR